MSDPDFVNIHDAKTHFSKPIKVVEGGGEVVIAKAGKPVAKLVPYAPVEGTRTLGLLAGKITVPDDFDTLGADEIVEMFEGR